MVERFDTSRRTSMLLLAYSLITSKKLACLVILDVTLTNHLNTNPPFKTILERLLQCVFFSLHPNWLIEVEPVQFSTIYNTIFFQGQTSIILFSSNFSSHWNFAILHLSWSKSDHSTIFVHFYPEFRLCQSIKGRVDLKLSIKSQNSLFVSKTKF